MAESAPSPSTSGGPMPGARLRAGCHRATSPSLGVTAIELLPVHMFIIDDRTLLREGTGRITGDTTPSASSRPNSRYASTSSSLRFRRLSSSRRWSRIVPLGNGHRGHPRRRLQPHPPRGTRTARPSRGGGMDNSGSYYNLSPRTIPGIYMDDHGLRKHPPDEPLASARPPAHHGFSLRYWVTGDARRRLPVRPRHASLAREDCTRFDKLGAFFDIMPPGPGDLSQVKLIAEPWDCRPRRLPGG